MRFSRLVLPRYTVARPAAVERSRRTVAGDCKHNDEPVGNRRFARVPPQTQYSQWIASTEVVAVTTATAAFALQLGSGNFLSLALAFFVLAILAGVAGFRGIAGLTMEIARLLVLIFIVLAIVALVL